MPVSGREPSPKDPPPSIPESEKTAQPMEASLQGEDGQITWTFFKMPNVLHIQNGRLESGLRSRQISSDFDSNSIPA